MQSYEFIEEAQKLYVRLFGRQYRWLIKSKIKYPKIAEDLTPFLQELVTSALLHDGIFIFKIQFDWEYVAVDEIITEH